LLKWERNRSAVSVVYFHPLLFPGGAKAGGNSQQLCLQTGIVTVHYIDTHQTVKKLHNYFFVASDM